MALAFRGRVAVKYFLIGRFSLFFTLPKPSPRMCGISKVFLGLGDKMAEVRRKYGFRVLVKLKAGCHVTIFEVMISATFSSTNALYTHESHIRIRDGNSEKPNIH